MTTPDYQTFARLMKERRFPDAITLAEQQCSQSRHGNSFWLTQCARALTASGKPDQALDRADAAVRLRPSDGYALCARADALVSLEKFTEARSDFESAASDPRVAGRAQRGMMSCLSREKRWSDILSSIGRCSMTPLDAFPWKVLALKELGREEDIMETCRDVLRLSPDNRDALWTVTEIEIKREGLPAVCERFGRLSRIPSRPPIYGEIYASLCKRAGNREQAARQYQHLADRTSDPRNRKKHLFNLANAGHEREAIPLMEEFLRIDPRDYYMHKSYCAACKRVDEHDRAWNFYTELLSRYPEEKALHHRRKEMRKEDAGGEKAKEL